MIERPILILETRAAVRRPTENIEALLVFQALPQLNRLGPAVSSGVAVWAHIAGFFAGALLIELFRNDRLLATRAR